MKSKWPSLAGHLLVATPKLMDPNFFQTIIYLMHHDDQGALGFVLNRPTDESLNEVIGDQSDRRPIFDRIQVLAGGPVNRDQLSVMMIKQMPEGPVGLPDLVSSIDTLEVYAKKGEFSIFAFRGYAGWSEGQLDEEIRDGAWRVRDMDPIILNRNIVKGLWPFLNNGDNRWRALLDYLPQNYEWN